mgnify:CR=1 FL=1
MMQSSENHEWLVSSWPLRQVRHNITVQIDSNYLDAHELGPRVTPCKICSERAIVLSQQHAGMTSHIIPTLPIMARQHRTAQDSTGTAQAQHRQHSTAQHTCFYLSLWCDKRTANHKTPMIRKYSPPLTHRASATSSQLIPSPHHSTDGLHRPRPRARRKRASRPGEV